jgi:hypothetical protein
MQIIFRSSSAADSYIAHQEILEAIQCCFSIDKVSFQEFIKVFILKWFQKLLLQKSLVYFSFQINTNPMKNQTIFRMINNMR